MHVWWRVRSALAGVVFLGAAAAAQDIVPKKPVPAAVAQIVAGLGSDNPLAQSAARERVRGLDAQARAEAIDPVAGLLGANNPTTRAVAAFALGDLGPAALPAVGRLAVCLGDENSTVRYAAANALGGVGPGAAGAAGPALKRNLTDDSVPARLAAAEALFRVAEDVAAVPVLVAALDDENAANRRAAARVLGLYGPRAKAATGVLRRLLRDEDGFARVQAAEALWRVAQAAEAVPALAREMKSDGIARYVAAEALWGVNRDPEVIDALIAALRDPDATHRFLAALSIGRIGPPARKAAEALRKLADDEDEHVRTAAAASVGAVEKRSK